MWKWGILWSVSPSSFSIFHFLLAAHFTFSYSPHCESALLNLLHLNEQLLPQTTDLTGWHCDLTVTDHFNWFWKDFLSCFGTPELRSTVHTDCTASGRKPNSQPICSFPSGSHHWIWTVKLWSLEIQYWEFTQPFKAPLVLIHGALPADFIYRSSAARWCNDGDSKPVTKLSGWSWKDYLTLPGNL